MASKSVTLSKTEYTKLDTGSSTAILMQNTGDTNVHVVFASSLPAVSVASFFVLPPGGAIIRDQMTGDMYGLAAGNGLARVTVGE